MGGHRGSPLPGAGLQGDSPTPDRSRMGQPPVPGERCEPALAAGRAEPITGPHLGPGWGTRAEPGHSKTGSAVCASTPRQGPTPPASLPLWVPWPALSWPCSCFPATPSHYEQPGFPLWEISCFPDCRPAGFSGTSSLPPARRPAHRVRSACHAASMSE